MDLAPLLQIQKGVTALIGGGGKTTLMTVLTEELQPRGTVILCTSTKILMPTDYTVLTDGDTSGLRDALEREGAVCVGTPWGAEKLSAPSVSFRELAKMADYVLVEADGAHRLPLKAHAPHEPVIPAEARQVVLVLGADGFGKPIGEICHRPERYAALAGVGEEAVVTPSLCARVILSEGLGDCVYCNKVESEADYTMARELAGLLPCPVIAGSLYRGEYLCLR